MKKIKILGGIVLTIVLFFVIINVIPPKKNVKENLANPLYMIFYTMYRNVTLLKDIDIDFFFYVGKKVLKVNPSQADKTTYKQLRVEMYKIMAGIVPNETINTITKEEEMETENKVSTTTSEIIRPVETSDVGVITTNEELSRAKVRTPIEKEVEDKIKTKVKEVIKKDTIAKDKIVIDDDGDEVPEELSTNVDADIRKEIEEDQELIEKIYYQNKNTTKTKSSASTARDNLLREEQEKIRIGELTIEQIKKVNSKKVTVPVDDISNVVKTTNDNMKQVRFNNFDKSYNEKLMKKDIVDAILSLNNKSIPMFVRDIQIKDSSNELNYKDTYTILLEDGNRKRHTVKVDIPKFIDDKFLFLGENRKVIKNQNFFLPVVKISPNLVQIVTNYSKMTVERVDNKSVSSVERLKKLIYGEEALLKYFTIGNAFSNNKDFITTLDYDDLSKIYTSFECNGTLVMFDQAMVSEYMRKNNIKPKDKKIFIGKFKGKNCFIDINSQVDENNNSLVDIIVQSLPQEYIDKFGSIKAPKRLMYTKVRVMKQFLSVAMLLGLWEGLTSLTKKLKLEYRLEDSVPRNLGSDEDFIKFNDTVMVYKQDVPTALIMNGFRVFDTSKFNIADFDTKEPYIVYIKKVYGRAIIENALMNFYEFVIDPITAEVLEELSMPTDIVSLYIYAVKLLSDSQFSNAINQNFYRIRRNEIIPAILYEKLAKNYVTYRNHNGRKKFTIPQDCVIKELLGLKTVEDYSTINPIQEMQMLHNLSTKGFRGINLDEYYTMEKRGYDPSMTGIVSPSSPPDANVGLLKTLTLEPNIKNLRGFIEDKHDDLDSLKDVNLFSPSELTIPLAATIDDPNRLGHATKQSSHMIPVKESSPVLISNGMEEVSRFHLTSNFVINAEEDGEIIDYDDETKIMIAKYKSGKCRAIDLSPNIVKNGGGGFFLSNILQTDLKVGDKFKKNAILAYHKDFFKNDKFNNCRMTIGTLTKVAIMSTYNTYEDSTFITHSLSERCATEMCFCKSVVVGKNSNIFYMVNKGDEISVGDSLIQFDTSYEDESINKLLANLAKEEKENILEGARNDIKSKYSGIIEDIKIYPTVDLGEMSPSLKKLVSGHYRKINKKKDFLDKYDPENSNSIVKCGMLMNEVSHKVEPNKFGVIKGEQVEDSVLIEFYIKHGEPLEVGSKIANFTALKNTVGEIIEKGYEPFSSFRPDEEVSTIIASNSILNRMTPSILITALGNKTIIELKRYLFDLNYNREKMEKTIYSFFSAIDKSGKNTKKYKDLFEPMIDAQFKKYFKELFENKNAYLILNIVDYENSVTLDDITKAAKVINVPLFEYVTLPHLTMDKEHAVTSKIPVPVGYINVKRTQQTVMKKNGISTDISERSALTNQVTGKDKNGRESDMENIMLTSLGMKNTLKELNGPRADDAVMKQQMLRDIALNGYTRLADMTDEIENKTTLNTVDCYFRGMSLQTDLVVKGLMLPSTLKKEL